MPLPSFIPKRRRALRFLLVLGADRWEVLVKWDSGDLLLSRTGGPGFITE